MSRKRTDLLFLIRTQSFSTKSISSRSNIDFKMGGSVSDFGFVVLKYIRWLEGYTFMVTHWMFRNSQHTATGLETCSWKVLVVFCSSDETNKYIFSITHQHLTLSNMKSKKCTPSKKILVRSAGDELSSGSNHSVSPVFKPSARV